MTLVEAPAPLMDAAHELRFLLERGYPREQSLKLVGDRHALPALDRQALARAVTAPAVAAARRAKLLGLGDLAGARLAVDGHNQLITLQVGLSGGRLVAGDDGVTKDLAQLGRHHQPLPATDQAAALLVSTLAQAGVGSVRIWLDAPLTKSGELAARLRALLAGAGLAGDARTVTTPDRHLAAWPGPVASSDGQVLDAAPAAVDLAGLVLARWAPHVTAERFI